LTLLEVHPWRTLCDTFSRGRAGRCGVADQGLWFKLWCSTLDDPDLDNLALPDFARWAKLGALVKRQGTAGTLHLAPPGRALCAMFQVPDFESLLRCFMVLPHVTVRRDKVTVSPETGAIVTFENWLKYQGDFSTHRVRQFRRMKRSRGEEMRREEMRREETPPLPPHSGGPAGRSLERSEGPETAGQILARWKARGEAAPEGHP